jgi:hypothetical protein
MGYPFRESLKVLHLVVHFGIEEGLLLGVGVALKHGLLTMSSTEFNVYGSLILRQ